MKRLTLDGYLGTVAVQGLLLVIVATAASAEERAPLEEVLKVWREREEATRSFRFVISEDYVIGHGTAGPVEGPEPSGPPEDAKAKRRTTLTVDGDLMRIERLGQSWIASALALTPSTYISTFDGTLNKSFYQDVNARGFVSRRDKHGDAGNVYLSPVLRHFRPLSPVFGVFKLDRLKVVSTDAVLNDTRCIVLEEPQPDGLRVRKYWVAPEQAMAIIRYEGTFKGHPEVQADVTFKHDDKHGWVPHRWHAARFAEHERILSSGESVVADFDLNPKVPAQSFELDFPPGTTVSDATARRMYTVPLAEWDR
jgi:hypothetical protein